MQREVGFSGRRSDRCGKSRSHGHLGERCVGVILISMEAGRMSVRVSKSKEDSCESGALAMLLVLVAVKVRPVLIHRGHCFQNSTMGKYTMHLRYPITSSSCNGKPAMATAFSLT